MRGGNKKPQVLFELNCIDGRDITALSRYPAEEEILFLPHSYFKVESVKVISSSSTEINEQYFHIRLKQIQTPNNLKYIHELEKKKEYRL